MSRERFWEYRIKPRTPELDALWEAMCGPPHALLPTRVCNGGASNPEGVSVWLHANRAKAHRIAARLDSYFGAQGELVSEGVVMAELDADCDERHDLALEHVIPGRSS